MDRVGGAAGELSALAVCVGAVEAGQCAARVHS